MPHLDKAAAFLTQYMAGFHLRSRTAAANQNVLLEDRGAQGKKSSAKREKIILLSVDSHFFWGSEISKHNCSPLGPESSTFQAGLNSWKIMAIALQILLAPHHGVFSRM